MREQKTGGVAQDAVVGDHQRRGMRVAQVPTDKPDVLDRARAGLGPDAVIWVSWPKKAGFAGQT